MGHILAHKLLFSTQNLGVLAYYKRAREDVRQYTLNELVLERLELVYREK